MDDIGYNNPNMINMGAKSGIVQGIMKKPESQTSIRTTIYITTHDIPPMAA